MSLSMPQQGNLRANDSYDSRNSLKHAIKLNFDMIVVISSLQALQIYVIIQYMIQGAACDTMGFHIELHQDLPSNPHRSLPDTPSPAHRDPGKDSDRHVICGIIYQATNVKT